MLKVDMNDHIQNKGHEYEPRVRIVDYCFEVENACKPLMSYSNNNDNAKDTKKKKLLSNSPWDCVGGA